MSVPFIIKGHADVSLHLHILSINIKVRNQVPYNYVTRYNRAMEGERFLKILHAVNLKATQPRIEVLKVLARATSPLRIKDISSKLASLRSNIDTVTVYRTIESLLEKGMVRRVDFGEDSAYYELDSGEDIHHVSCTMCRSRENIKKCFFLENQKNAKKVLAQANTFASVTRHSIEYFGVCTKCASKTKTKNRRLLG